MKSQRYTRQSFLGANSEEILAGAKIGVIGVGGGGSQIVNLLAHPGFRNFVLVDPDEISESNLNRTVVAGWRDVQGKMNKAVLGERKIREVQETAIIKVVRARWQECAEDLIDCDIIFGCVDGFTEREQLEAFCRRFLIPLIDIGMDVYSTDRLGDAPQMAGQVILSMPGHSCMRCLGFITDEKVGREAAAYGAAGGRPQVVWPNAILAATAVGIAVDLLTDWTKSTRGPRYFSLDGNTQTVAIHPRLEFLKSTDCHHYDQSIVGAHRWKQL